MKAKNNDWVAVTYEGSFDNGEVFDKNDEKNPLHFQIGAGQVIKGFENAVNGLETGKEIIVNIKANEAYGEKNTKINDIPKEAFAGQDLSKIELNKELQIMSNMGPLTLEVKEISGNTIKAIINHPMAGKDLNFKIKLLKILNEKEVKELMDEMSHDSCSCGHDHECDCEESCECEDCEDEKHEHKHEHKSEKKK